MFRWLSNHPKRCAAVALALCCAGLGWMLLARSSGPGAAFIRASYDSYFNWFNLAEGLPGDSPVVIIYLDLESHLNKGLDPSKPWPRGLHAQLLHRLKSAGARAVVFDIVFDGPGADAVADRELEEALRAQGASVLAAEISVASQATGEGAWGRTMKLALPMDSFRAAAAAWGLGEVAVDDDFVARRHFNGRSVDGEVRPSLAWATGRLLGIGSVSGQPQTGEPRWFRYYGPPFTIPHVGFSKAMEAREVDDAVFRDRIVFIGARPMAGLFKERRDELRGPFHSWGERDLFMPGVEVHATQMLNLMRKDWLTRWSAGTEWWAVTLAGILFALGCMALRPVPASAAALAGGGAVMALAVALHHQANIWFPWLIVVAVQLPAALGGSVLFHSLEWYRTRRRMEAAKRVADALIREQAALIDKAQDAILVSDLEGRITYANPGAEKLYGWSLDDLRAGAHGALFDDPPAQDARRLTLERGEWSGELNHPSRSGKVLRIESRWTLLRDEDGRARGLLMIHSDVTEKRQLEAEAVRMQRMEALGSLAGGMAHDLNNALAPILMGAQLLRRDSKDENVRRVLALMESSTRRGADMVRQVLLFARGRHGEFEPVHVSALVQEMTKLAQDTFPKGIVVSAQVAEDLWLVRGDTTQLHQVLLNLCVNARDAMPQGGALSLAADNVTLDAPAAATLAGGRTGEFVVMMVSDTGTGMSPGVMARVFEPFFTTKPEGAGTGLGLSTTARIAKAHGGFVAMQSAPGEGTTFEVYLPRLSRAVLQETRAAPAPVPRGQGELILVAEDDAAVRELLKRSLEEHGYRILAATNGAEAVSIFKAQPGAVALVVSDCSMPLLDGPQAVAVMRELKPGLPVLLLGGETQEARGVGENGRGNSRFLPKPMDLDSLLHEVAALLGRG